MSLMIVNLQSSKVGHELFDSFTKTELTITDSPDVKRVLISRYSRISDLRFMLLGITSIEGELNENLRRLQIIGSPLETLSPSIGNLKNLEILTIMRCLLSEVDLGMFCNLRYLNMLILPRNKIHTIVSRIKSTPCKLAMTSINLQKNVIKILNLELFNRCNNLERLDLSFNQIELVVGRFVNQAIANIYFNENRIKQMNLCQWETPSLLQLYLNANLLSALPACIDKIKSLETINMPFNNLTHFESIWLEPLENLIDFDLSSNRIVSLFLHGFPKQLSSLDLGGNDLKSVDFSYDPNSKTCVKLETYACMPLNELSHLKHGL
ncbi:leucine-rich repeat-containing protein 40-like isoform X2 [Anopheles albimanus]|nr:leucine-rich repeat-containing protein 40-like isoform X2 [Anopheles albimanus]